MPSSKTSTAILAKARAMYGKCLTDKDYDELMECHTVSEVAAYLKTRTNYASVLTGLNENDVHRGQLEPLLRQNIYYDVTALSRYSQNVNISSSFSDFIISKMEVEQIMRCLTLMNTGRPQEYVYTVPLSLDKFTEINLRGLASAKTYDDVLEVLKGTKYFSTLQKFKPKDEEKINIANLEVQLTNEQYGRLLDAVSKSGSKTDRNEIKDIFSAILDFENISRILRLKKYYNFSAVQIKGKLIPYGRLSEKVIDELCAAETVQDVFERSRSTYVGKLMSKLQYNDLTQIKNAMVGMYCKHHLRLSANPTIVMISYIYLKELELTNIINIIEATRYGISASEKTKLLVR